MSIINWSYRRRGSVARTQTKRIATRRAVVGVEMVVIEMSWGFGTMKIEVVRILISKIFVYSAIKMRAKLPALYSILKPETSSDSPSAKSNGVRFVSAKIEVIHIMASGRIIIILMDVDEYSIFEKS